jgi:hypothetical protein
MENTNAESEKERKKPSLTLKQGAASEPVPL